MKSKITAWVLAAAVVITCLSAVSCGEKLQKFTAYSFDYFDTVTVITGYAVSQEAFDAEADRILSSLDEYHRLFTIYHRYEGLENLCTVNELKDGAHRTVKVDDRIIQMLLYAKEMYQMTRGKVNVAMGSVLSLWHSYREVGMGDPASAQLPPMEKLTEAAKHTDINCLVIDETAGTVTLTDPRMTLDVGAVAKGYAVEMVAQELEARGISGYVLNVGGNVRTVGAKGDGTPWVVGIENPIETEGTPYLAYLSLSGESLVTSGSYQRYYVVDGRSYHHIIHPETLMPAEGFLSVSVVTANSAQGDALSTALFCMSYEEGLSLVEALPDIEAMWVMQDGTQRYSEGFLRYTAD